MANRRKLKEMLDLTCEMWDDPWAFHYQNHELADSETHSVFLAGPSSRQDILEFKWRAYAVHYLRKAGFKGIIYVPEPRENDWSFKETFEEKIVAWESMRLLNTSMVMFWVPRHETQLPGRVTNTELGFCLGMAYANPDKFKDRMVFGCPPNAWKVKSEKHYSENIVGIKPFDNLQIMCEHVKAKLGSWMNY